MHAPIVYALMGLPIIVAAAPPTTAAAPLPMKIGGPNNFPVGEVGKTGSEGTGDISADGADPIQAPDLDNVVGWGDGKTIDHPIPFYPLFSVQGHDHDDSAHADAMDDCQDGICTKTVTHTGVDVVDVPNTSTYGAPIETTPVYGTESTITATIVPSQPSYPPQEPEVTSTICTTSNTPAEEWPGTEAPVPTGPATSDGPVYSDTIGVPASDASTASKPSGYEKSTPTSAGEGPTATPSDEGHEQSASARIGIPAGIVMTLALGSFVLAMI